MKLDASYTEQQRKTVGEQLPAIVPAADAARLAGLGAALALQGAQQFALTINRARNAAKYGPAADQVGAMDVRLEEGEQAMQQMLLAQARAQLVPPQLPANAAGIFGRVSDQDGNGIARAAILALNQAGGQAAKATTSADGSYQMTVPVRAAAAARGRIVTESAAASAEPSIVIQLQVSVGGKIVLTDEEMLTLRAGDIVLRELTVAGAATDKTAA
ncbi:carboxypeptidase-like regulatory domain-containing protein [Reyranella sp.]|uniref:carboxypeptidase-like regulatory domain-containing protein n=1 Tax=Reyranella sp. TaxID=1929291 RepID=UPI003D09E02A